MSAVARVTKPGADIGFARAPGDYQMIPASSVPPFPLVTLFKSVDFSGVGSLSVTAPKATVTIPASFTGAGALVLSGQTLLFNLNLSSVGTLSASAVVPVEAAFTGSGTAEAEVALPAGYAVFTGLGALTTTSVNASVSAPAGLAGSGTLSVSIVVSGGAVPVTAVFTGLGALTASSVVSSKAAAGLTGAGSLSATTLLSFPLPLSGSGTLSAISSRTVTAGFTGSGALSAVITAPSPQLVSGTAVVSDFVSTTSMTLAYPSGSAAGDLIVVGAWAKRSFTVSMSVVLSGGANWRRTQIRNQDAESPAFHYVYYWTFRGAETGLTLTCSTADSGVGATMVAYKASTVDALNPVGSANDAYSNLVSGALSTPSFDTPMDLVELLLFAQYYDADNTAFTMAWTGNTVSEISDYGESILSDYLNNSAAHDQKAVAGTVSAYTATSSYGTINRRTVCAVQVLPSNPSFPAVVDSVTGSADTGGVATVITAWPAAEVTGDLRVVLYAADGGQTLSTSSSGWTKLGQVSNSTADTLGVFIGIAGTANNSLTITHAGSVHRAWTVQSIRRWSGTLAHVEMATATGSSATVDPPSLTPSHGSRPYLWLAVSTPNGGQKPISDPAGFVGRVDSTCLDSSSSAHQALAVSWNLANVATLNPGTFTIPVSGAWSAATIAIRA